MYKRRIFQLFLGYCFYFSTQLFATNLIFLVISKIVDVVVLLTQRDEKHPPINCSLGEKK